MGENYDSMSLYEWLCWSHQEVGDVWRPKMCNKVEMFDLS